VILVKLLQIFEYVYIIYLSNKDFTNLAELYSYFSIFVTVPTQDQALQQVIILKKELAEMRANQALAEDKNIQSLTMLDREVGRARGLVTDSNPDAEMERSAHRETMEALEASENSVRITLFLYNQRHIQTKDVFEKQM
jgi:hypothetical protein